MRYAFIAEQSQYYTVTRLCDVIIIGRVLDLFSRKIVGWSMGERLTSELAQRALSHAIEQSFTCKGIADTF